MTVGVQPLLGTALRREAGEPVDRHPRRAGLE